MQPQDARSSVSVVGVIGTMWASLNTRSICVILFLLFDLFQSRLLLESFCLSPKQLTVLPVLGCTEIQIGQTVFCKSRIKCCKAGKCFRHTNLLRKLPSFFLQLGGSSTLSMDVSSVIRDDYDASLAANVAHVVTGWTPLMDSSLKGSVVLNATANSSYEQVEVRGPGR